MSGPRLAQSSHHNNYHRRRRHHHHHHHSRPAMSDDDTGSIVTNPFDRDIITDEVLAENEKLHWENPAWRGPSFRSLDPTPPGPKRKDRKGALQRPRSGRRPRLLDGIDDCGLTQYLQGLERLPNGRVYSRRLEAQRLNKTAAPPAVAARPPPRQQLRRPPKPGPATVPAPSKTCRVQKKRTGIGPRVAAKRVRPSA